MFKSEQHMAFFAFKCGSVQLLALPSRRVWLDEVCYAYKERTRKDIEHEHDPAKVRCLPMCHEMYTAAC